jgi:hypothetical protein
VDDGEYCGGDYWRLTLARYRIGRIIIEIGRISNFGYPCGNTFIPDRAKCYTDPKTGARLKVPLTKQQIEKVRSRSAGAERLYAEQESRVRRLPRSNAAEKGIKFPTSPELDKAQFKGMRFSDPDSKISSFIATTPDGQKFIAKGNVTEYGVRNSRSDGKFEQLRKAEIATKEVADEIGLGKYYLPVTERKVDIFKDGMKWKTPVIVTPYIEGATKYKSGDSMRVLHSKLTNSFIDDGTDAIAHSRVAKDVNKLVGMDYVLGHLKRTLPLVPNRAGAYLVDNGLSFTPAVQASNGVPGHLYAGLTPHYNSLLDGLDLEQKIDKSILGKGGKIVAIAKKHGLPTSGILQRLEAMGRHKIWKDLIHEAF